MPAALTKALEKAVALANSAHEPETLIQFKSLGRKAVAVASPLAAHAMWAIENPAEQDVDGWNEVYSASEWVFQANAEGTYALEAADVELLEPVEALAEAAAKMRS